jgi:D-3-phosphoglycerate dehydrogenase / 2-oxoglutarate reductase
MTGIVLALDSVGVDLAPEESVLRPLGIRVAAASRSTPTRQEQLRDADALLVNVTAVDGRLLDRCPRCRAVVTYGVGYDHIDVAEVTKRGVIVANVPDYCTEEVADHAMALLLALARQLLVGNDVVLSGRWGVQELGPIRRLRGRTIGLVGYGRTGRAVATRSAAFGLRVLATDPLIAAGNHAPATLTSLRSLLAESDFVSLHAPLVRDTARLINAETIKLMKDDAVLINTSRGGLVDMPELLDALDSGRLGAAGLDVFDEEPPPTGRLDRQNLVVSPHSAYYSTEAILELKRSAAQAAAVVLTGGVPTHRLT